MTLADIFLFHIRKVIDNFDFHIIPFYMKCLSKESIASLGTLIALDIAEGKSTEEICILRNIATQITATLNTLIAQDALCKKLKK